MPRFSSFLAVIVSLTFYAAVPRPILAQAPLPSVTVSDATAEAMAGQEKIDYALPYPGILPDHPLYFLKQLRDLIMDILIVDPFKKIDFYVLQADKKLNMGLMLIDKGKLSLAAATTIDGEKFLEKAVTDVVQYRSQGKEVPSYIIEKLEDSSVKHEQVLTDILVKLAEEQKTLFTPAVDLVKKVQQDLSNVR